VHGKKAKEHDKEPLWEKCLLQSYFTTRSRVNYFVVIEKGTKDIVGQFITNPVLSQPETDLFIKLEKDYKNVKGDIEEQANIVHNFEDSKFERMPWLETTRFPSHMARLRDEEIRGSYKLPPKKELDWNAQGAVNADLIRILVAAESMLRNAYQLCSDSSAERKMTQQRANILNKFYTGALGRVNGFRYFKNSFTLIKYFTAIKQLLVYYYRVIYKENGHFTRTQPD